MKDWTGNNRTLGATLGASYLASGERPREDYYATHPDMVRDLLNAGAPLRRRVWVFSERRTCAKNGDFSKTEGGAIAYAWFHWIKSYRGNCTIKWL